MSLHALDVRISDVTRIMNRHQRAMEDAERRGFVAITDIRRERRDRYRAEYDRLCAEANALAERGAS